MLEPLVYLASVRDACVYVKVYVRQEIDFVHEKQIRRSEHVRIVRRLVVAFGHREDRDLRTFAEIEERRSDQVADVFHDYERD